METVGWIGAALFALCGLPQALESIRNGHSRGLSWLFLIMWLGGEILTIAYVAWKSFDWVLLSNYLTNVIFLFVIVRYKIWERK